VHVRLITRKTTAGPDAACNPLNGDWPGGCWFGNYSTCWTAIRNGGYDHCGWDYGAGCTKTDACGVDY